MQNFEPTEVANEHRPILRTYLSGDIPATWSTSHRRGYRLICSCLNLKTSIVSGYFPRTPSQAHTYETFKLVGAPASCPAGSPNDRHRKRWQYARTPPRAIV